MSRNTNNVKSEAKKLYCKVCYDAGKPESEYTSHCVKDLTGKTICPTLLNTECRYCYKLGHTAKFCNVLAKNKKVNERLKCSEDVTSHKQPAPAVQKKSQNAGASRVNVFASLCGEDSESEEEEVSNQNEARHANEYPALCEVTKKVETEVKSGWAAIVAKPIQQPVKDKVEELKLAGWVSSHPKQTQMKSWADCSDSEDDEPPRKPVLKRVPATNHWNGTDIDVDDELPPNKPVLKRVPATGHWDGHNDDVDDDW